MRRIFVSGANELKGIILFAATAFLFTSGMALAQSDPPALRSRVANISKDRTIETKDSKIPEGQSSISTETPKPQLAGKVEISAKPVAKGSKLIRPEIPKKLRAVIVPPEEDRKPIVLCFKGKFYVVPEKVPAAFLKAAATPKLRKMVIKNWAEFRSDLRKGDVYWTLLSMWHDEEGCYQTLVDFQGRTVLERSLASGPAGDVFLPLTVHPESEHGHLGIFLVGYGKENRSEDHWSKEYKCHMYWALRFWGGHFLHAALPKVIRKLGLDDSHGCGRNEPPAAKRRYNRAGEHKFWVLSIDEEDIAKVFNLTDRNRLKQL